MELKMTNSSVQLITEYLPKLKLKGKENRARQKLLNKTANRFQELYSDIQEVKSEYPDDLEKQSEDISELFKEEIVIDMTEYSHLMPILYDILMDYPYEIDTKRTPGMPSDPSIHDLIVDVLEEAIEVECDKESLETKEVNNMEVE